MASFRAFMRGIKPTRTQISSPVASAPPLECLPLMVAYTLSLTIEGNLSISLIPKLLDTMFLAWLIELFKKAGQWGGCLGYLWKSMKERTTDTLNIHPLSPDTCHMLVSSCDFMGFTDGSCIPSDLKVKKFEGSSSWELMSDADHLIVISLSYRVTLQTFNHNQRNSLRNNGFQKLEILTKKEYELMNYMGVKNSKPYYNHEKSFEKLLLKLRGPKTPRVRAILHSHQTDQFNDSPPPYQGTSEEDS